MLYSFQICHHFVIVKKQSTDWSWGTEFHYFYDEVAPWSQCVGDSQGCNAFLEGLGLVRVWCLRFTHPEITQSHALPETLFALNMGRYNQWQYADGVVWKSSFWRWWKPMWKQIATGQISQGLQMPGSDGRAHSSQTLSFDVGRALVVLMIAFVTVA